MDDLIKDSTRKYGLLLDLLFELGDSINELKSGYDERLLDARGILIKFINHCCTINQLINSTRYKFKDKNISFLDFSSIDVVARSAIESFLVLYYVFDEPINEIEEELRYNAWLMSGLVSRMSFEPFSEKSRKVLAKDVEFFNSVKDKLKNNAIFRNLSDKQQNEIVLKGKWKLEGEYNGKIKTPSWIDIGIKAGFDKNTAKDIYKFLSGYTHCDSLSIIQIREAHDNAIRRNLADGTLEIMIMVMAFMIKTVTNVFHETGKVLTQNNINTELYKLVIDTFTSKSCQ